VTLRVANGAGFLGDQLDAPRFLVERAEVDCLTLEYLAELTLSILASAKAKDPRAGYARDFVDVLGGLSGALKDQPRLSIVTNAGGVNPSACAAAAGKVLAEAGLADLPVGLVWGDDLVPRMAELEAEGCRFTHLDTGEPFSTVGVAAASCNAYLGAESIARALAAGSRIVITGRVADASLTVGPAVRAFGWDWSDWNRLASASVAGHLIECGAQATGGLYGLTDRLGLADVGYPIAELREDGTCEITKPPGSGGVVNVDTVAEQMVYEIGDPRHYLTPDVDVDFTTVELEETGADRVRVTGATGRPPPETYKVSLAYRAGYFASAQLLAWGKDCVSKARDCAEIIRRRLERTGIVLDAYHAECLGAGEGVPGLSSPAPGEVMLRISVRDRRREAVERFTKEIAPLITSGPPGLAGYAAGRSTVRPVLAYWPTSVPRSMVQAEMRVTAAAEWAETSG
jgi:hypothetical protein